MTQRLSWEEIKQQYPEQWVRLENVEWVPGNDATVNSAVVTKSGNITTQERIDAVHKVSALCSMLGQNRVSTRVL